MMERVGFGLLLLGAIAYLVFLVAMLILAFPFGVIGLLFLTGIAILFVKVFQERVNNQEDDHYSKNVHQ
jgi:membrane protein implicated in regulation of membrane protease activity